MGSAGNGIGKFQGLVLEWKGKSKVEQGTAATLLSYGTNHQPKNWTPDHDDRD
jgi:hypothetical protein